MKRILLWILLVGSSAGVYSCTKDNRLQVEVAPVVTQAEALRKFNHSIKSLRATFAQDEHLYASVFEQVYNDGGRTLAPLSPEEQSKLDAIIAEFTSNSDSFLASFDVPDAGDLSTEEKLLVSLLIYADNYDKVVRQAPRGGRISDIPVVNCIVSAVGLSDITLVATGRLTDTISKYGAKYALKTVAKFAGKAVTGLGWAIVAYDFATCMWDDVL